MAGSSILARVSNNAFVDIDFTVLAREVGRAVASVRVHAVHTAASILAEVANAVINVHLAAVPLEAWRTGASVSVVPNAATVSTIFARVGAAGNVGAAAVFASVALFALTPTKNDNTN